MKIDLTESDVEFLLEHCKDEDLANNLQRQLDEERSNQPFTRQEIEAMHLILAAWLRRDQAFPWPATDVRRQRAERWAISVIQKLTKLRDRAPSERLSSSG